LTQPENREKGKTLVEHHYEKTRGGKRERGGEAKKRMIRSADLLGAEVRAKKVCLITERAVCGVIGGESGKE